MIDLTAQYGLTFVDADRDAINKQLADSLYFRGKTLLAVNRPQHALKVIDLPDR